MDITALLTVLAAVPLVGSLLGFGLRGRTGKIVTMTVALITLVLGVVVFVISGNTQLSVQVPWIAQIGAYYALSLDGMGRAMVLLTVILVPVVLAAEWDRADNFDAPEAAQRGWGGNVYGALALMLESFALVVFMAADVLLFYIFFEATLIPMFFLITGWGKQGKAAIKFLIYSLAGGLVMLFAVIGLYQATAASASPTFLIQEISSMGINGNTGILLFIGFFFAFALKAPMVPVHTWLPDTAEESTPGSATLLVGILDKIGTFGMLRLCLGLFPEASLWATPFVVTLAVISVIYGAVMAVTSKHLMRLVSYTSVSHFGFMVLGIFAFTTTAISGSIYYMLAHGFSSAAMFIAVGFLHDRRGSYMIDDYGSAQKNAPVLAGVFLIAGLATLGLPGTASFVGEFSIMIGAWPVQTGAVICCLLGVVLAAVYVLWAYQRVFTAKPFQRPEQIIQTDINFKERLVIAPLIALLLVFGFVPNLMLRVVEPTAAATMTTVGTYDPAPQTEGQR